MMSKVSVGDRALWRRPVHGSPHVLLIYCTVMNVGPHFARVRYRQDGEYVERHARKTHLEPVSLKVEES